LPNTTNTILSPRFRYGKYVLSGPPSCPSFEFRWSKKNIPVVPDGSVYTRNAVDRREEIDRRERREDRVER
jgi:hypothetical protein